MPHTHSAAQIRSPCRQMRPTNHPSGRPMMSPWMVRWATSKSVWYIACKCTGAVARTKQVTWRLQYCFNGFWKSLRVSTTTTKQLSLRIYNQFYLLAVSLVYRDVQCFIAFFNRHLVGYNAVYFLLALLSGVPDFFDRNKILSGGDLSHYQVPHCISFLLFCLICVYSSQFSILFWIMYLL